MANSKRETSIHLDMSTLSDELESVIKECFGMCGNTDGLFTVNRNNVSCPECKDIIELESYSG